MKSIIIKNKGLKIIHIKLKKNGVYEVFRHQSAKDAEIEIRDEKNRLVRF